MSKAFDVEDYVGKCFDGLTIVKPAGKDKWGCNQVECVNDEGKHKVYKLWYLLKYEAKSHNFSSLSPDLLPTGYSKSRLYKIWTGMRRRCGDDKVSHCEMYAVRGIKICDEWKDDYYAFYKWSMSHGYADDLTIDRINGDGNYEPNNCRWVNHTMQMCNRKVFKSNTTGYRGINKYKNKWVVFLTNGPQYNLGYYETQREALAIRNACIIANKLPNIVQEYHGEMVIINDKQKQVQAQWEEEQKCQNNSQESNFK